jgi:hypothetical protein
MSRQYKFLGNFAMMENTGGSCGNYCCRKTFMRVKMQPFFKELKSKGSNLSSINDVTQNIFDSPPLIFTLFITKALVLSSQNPSYPHRLALITRA